METVTEQPSLSPAILEALAVGNLPDVEWKHEDDLCDCTFQRIGMWKNPYIAETHEIRLCCVWAKLGEQYPDMVRSIPGYFDENDKEWITSAREWDGETEMPKALWYRQIAHNQNRPLSEVRAEYADKDHLRPRGKVRQPKPRMLLQWSGEWIEVELG